MAKLTKADAARQLGISRTTLYKLIDQGKLSATPDGLIDTAELVRIMSTLDVHAERPRTSVDTTPLDAYTRGDEHRERPVYTSSEHAEQMSSERQLTSTYRDLVDILREQLNAAQERERDYREHIARLTAMLHDAHQQNPRLLDMPHSVPVPASPDPRAFRGHEVPRGEMRRCIVALLQGHSEGLSPAQVRQRLGSAKDLQSTMKHMVREGLLRRVERGQYIATEPSRHA
jgi:Helix-turn-helix domain